MRFINLTRARKKNYGSSYDTIIDYNCGPNFVMNRRNEFETMVHSQGITFFFRFWLTFCFYPGCYAMKIIYGKCPLARAGLLIHIHKHFLEGTIEDTIRYSFDQAIMSLTVSDESTMSDFSKTPEDLLIECSEMVFGAALCRMFYDWLGAMEVFDKSLQYWKIPDEYLDPGFKPGLLEKYLVRKWQDHLIPLLGVNLRQIPWVLKEMYSGNMDNFDRQISSKIEYRMIENLKLCIEKEKLHIIKSDEPSVLAKSSHDSFLARSQEELESCKQVNAPLFILNCILQNREMCISNDDMKDMIKNGKTKRWKNSEIKCCFCANVINPKKPYRKCQQCVADNWQDTRCYCDDKCQMEHWFQFHFQEHKEMASD